MESEFHSIVEQAITGREEVYITAPTESSIAEVILSQVNTNNTRPTFRVIANKEAAKKAFSSFLLASYASEMRAQDRLYLKTPKSQVTNNLLITNNEVRTLIQNDGHYLSISSELDSLVDEVRSKYSGHWEQEREYPLHVPRISTVRESLAESVGLAVSEDFIELLYLAHTRDSHQLIDSTTAALLAAARNNKLLYDISEWGSNLNIASKATFSRKKSVLEDAGIIDLQKQPVDVGRPRLRLLIHEEIDDDHEQLIQLVEERL